MNPADHAERRSSREEDLARILRHLLDEARDSGIFTDVALKDLEVAIFAAATRSSRSHRSQVGALAAAAMVAALVTALVAVVASFGDLARSAAWASAAATSVGALTAGAVAYYLGHSRLARGGRASAPSDRLFADFVKAFVTLEDEMGAAVGRADRRVTVSLLIPGLLQAGYWDEDDVSAFRSALGIRNRLMHAGGEPVGSDDLKAATTVLAALTAKVRERRPTTPTR